MVPARNQSNDTMYRSWILLMICLLPIVPATDKRPEEEGPTSTPAMPPPSSNWSCPTFPALPGPTSNSFSCNCVIDFTLRCDGGLTSEKNQALSAIINHVGGLSTAQKVTLLDISVRNITKLPPRIFENITTRHTTSGLEGLVISSGHLKNISMKAFLGLEHCLTALGLPDNQLFSIPAQAVSGLSKLTRLDLSGNQISSVNSLPSLPDLEYLDLSRNSIKLLAAGVLHPLPHLKTLLLSENSLENAALTHHNLQHLSYLSILDLASNKLTGVLEPPTLDLFPPNLKSLDLSFNTLQTVRRNTFRSLTGLQQLSLQGNLLEEVEDLSFLGLLSLQVLDLSHNNILTFSTESLAGLESLSSLILSHNHLQVVSPLWMTGAPLLQSLLVMDNDITIIEEEALDGVLHLADINLAGNPLNCDCQISYFYSWLHSSPHPLTNSSYQSPLCSTPIQLTNAPVYQLTKVEPCKNLKTENETERDSSQFGGDYYKYYSEEGEESHQSSGGKSLSNTDIKMMKSELNQTTNHLALTWNVDAGALPYRCGQLHIFEEIESEGVVLVTHDTLDCQDTKGKKLRIDLDLEKYQLSYTKRYIICISLVKDNSVIPGCSGSLNLTVTNNSIARTNVPEEVEIKNLEEQVEIHSLRANVSLSGSNVMVRVGVWVPPNLVHSHDCSLRVTVGALAMSSSPLESPLSGEDLAVRTLNCSTGKTVLTEFMHLPPHTYFNVCAVVSVMELWQVGSIPHKLTSSQCLLSSAPHVRYETKSVLPLLLTLVFLALGIACLTVLFMIVRRHREDSKQSVFIHTSTVSPLMGICWRLRNKRGKPAFFLDEVDDDTF